MLNSCEATEVFAEKNIRNIVLIDERCLERECFVKAVQVVQPSLNINAFGRIGEWTDQIGQTEIPAAVLYSTLGRRIAERNVADEIATLERVSRPVPVIVLSPFEELSEMIAALECGARGYIPSSLGIEAMLTAVRLSTEGAVFMTTASLLAVRGAKLQRMEDPVAASSALSGVMEEEFTARQSAVADRLRRGKPNKLIAYELNMCESTVKVHIRNIMKKLRATNRTEAGFKLNALVAKTERSSVFEDNDRQALASERNGTESAVLARTKHHSSSATAPGPG